jgi:DeoR/GlpR family transcriptional regulator of sugar metabolism
MSDTGQRRRLKRKDLVAAVFVLFSEEYDRRGADSILDIELPLKEVRRYLLARFGIDYTSDFWIWTQLGKYEEEANISLFRKREDPEGLVLGIARDMSTYFQKEHLYVTQKIKVANGVLELMRNEPEGRSGPLSILLGAGSTVARIAEALVEGLESFPGPWRVATHNLGVIQTLGRAGPHSSRIELTVPEGRVDPVTNLILWRNEDFYAQLCLDWVIEGSSFLKDGELYVESAEETLIKSAILRRCPGRKVLVLTGHEAVASLPPGLSPFGRVEAYDYVVLPRFSRESSRPSRFDLAFAAVRERFEPFVLTWNYEILKAGRAPAPMGGPRA